MHDQRIAEQCALGLNRLYLWKVRDVFSYDSMRVWTLNRVEWYHFKCLGLVSPRQGLLNCHPCRKMPPLKDWTLLKCRSNMILEFYYKVVPKRQSRDAEINTFIQHKISSTNVSDKQTNQLYRKLREHFVNAWFREAIVIRSLLIRLSKGKLL